MKQLIIGIYDDGCDYTICGLIIENNKTTKEMEFSEYDIKNMDESNNFELKQLGKAISYNYVDTLKQYLLNNYEKYDSIIGKYDSIIICDNGWVTIVK